MKTPESPLDCKEIKPVNHKKMNPEYLLDLTLKLQYFGHLTQSIDSLWALILYYIGSYAGKD